MTLTKHLAVSSHRSPQASSRSRDPLMQCRPWWPNKHTGISPSCLSVNDPQVHQCGLTSGMRSVFHSDSGESVWRSLKTRHKGCARLCPRAARGLACHPRGSTGTWEDQKPDQSFIRSVVTVSVPQQVLFTDLRHLDLLTHNSMWIGTEE